MTAEARCTRNTPTDFKTLHRRLNPPVAESCIVIPLDAVKDGEPSCRGIYEPAVDLPWFVERLTNEIRAAYAAVAVLSVADVTGLDCLKDNQLGHFLSNLEDQLERCAAMGECASRMILAQNRSEARA